jgi:hypothetical protein
MVFVTVLGVSMVAAGLGGLGYCVREGYAIRREKPAAEVATARLRKLVAVNLGSVCLAALGLGVVVVGLVLG